MSEERRAWLLKRLALYERFKALKLRQEDLDKDRALRQSEINKEWVELSAEHKKLLGEEPQEGINHGR